MKPRKFSKAEIEEYFSGDRIQCLVCGKTYKRLARHLQVHSLTEDDYRDIYGLPWRRGLCGKEAHEAYSKATRKRMEDGFMPPCNPDYRAKAHEAIRVRGIRTQPFKKEICQENIAKSNGREAYSSSCFGEICERILSGRSAPDVCSDSDMPGLTWFRKYLRNHPSDKEKLLAKIDKLPFPAQATIGYGMGPRFWETVVKLRSGNKSDHVIAKETGVTAMTINRGRRNRGIA